MGKINHLWQESCQTPNKHCWNQWSAKAAKLSREEPGSWLVSTAYTNHGETCHGWDTESQNAFPDEQWDQKEDSHWVEGKAAWLHVGRPSIPSSTMGVVFQISSVAIANKLVPTNRVDVGKFEFWSTIWIISPNLKNDDTLFKNWRLGAIC